MPGQDQLPTMLYKYVTVETAQKILATGRLRWATPSTLRSENDPFEFSIDVSAETFAGALVADIGEKLEQSGRPPLSADDISLIHEQVLEDKTYRSGEFQLKQQLARCTVLCLTTDPCNHAMWTHYGERHRGVVLGFSTDDSSAGAFKNARPVSYGNRMPSMFDAPLKDLFDVQDTLDQARRIVELSIYSKPQSYSFEQEWRLFSGWNRLSETEADFLPFERDDLRQIVLGSRISSTNAIAVGAMARDLFPRCSVERLEQSPSSYDLVRSQA